MRPNRCGRAVPSGSLSPSIVQLQRTKAMPDRRMRTDTSSGAIVEPLNRPVSYREWYFSKSPEPCSQVAPMAVVLRPCLREGYGELAQCSFIAHRLTRHRRTHREPSGGTQERDLCVHRPPPCAHCRPDILVRPTSIVLHPIPCRVHRYHLARLSLGQHNSAVLLRSAST
jgi:hypothetical protein